MFIENLLILMLLTLLKYLLFAILLHLPVTGVIFLTTLFKVEYLQFGLIFYGLIIYWYATKKIMPRILHVSHKRIKKVKKD